jgi:hypothetical protein
VAPLARERYDERRERSDREQRAGELPREHGTQSRNQHEATEQGACDGAERVGPVQMTEVGRHPLPAAAEQRKQQRKLVA